MGGFFRGARTGLRGAVAIVADPGRRACRSDHRGARDAAERSGLAADDRVGVERGGSAVDGPGAVPRDVPVLRGGRQAVLPALPAQRRSLPGRAVQHRLLRAADPHGGAAGGAGAGRLHLGRRRLPHLQQPRLAGLRATGTGSVSLPRAGDRAGIIALRLRVRRLHAGELPAPPGSAGAGGGVTVHMIWAEARDRVIGAGGGIPWQLPGEQAMFKERTMGATIVMGRAPGEALPRRPLPGRANVVLTRDLGFVAPGAAVAHSVDEVPLSDDVWIIGG